MRIFHKLLLLVLAFSLALHAKAGIPGMDGKIEGTLNGYVTDAVTKKPLPGVTVLAIMPGTNRSKEAMTDADGYFHFMQLPAAQVTVQFDKKGYQPCKRQGVTVTEKTSVRLNIEC
jgi:Carboxypeptidase regulatory-like domain